MDSNTSYDAEIAQDVWSSIADASLIACARGTPIAVSIYGSCAPDYHKRRTKVSLEISIELSELTLSRASSGSARIVSPLSRELSRALQQPLIAVAYIIASKEYVAPAVAARFAPSPPGCWSRVMSTVSKLSAGIAEACRRRKKRPSP